LLQLLAHLQEILLPLVAVLGEQSINLIAHHLVVLVVAVGQLVVVEHLTVRQGFLGKEMLVAAITVKVLLLTLRAVVEGLEQ
jgi:hypothetical protein